MEISSRLLCSVGAGPHGGRDPRGHRFFSCHDVLFPFSFPLYFPFDRKKNKHCSRSSEKKKLLACWNKQVFFFCLCLKKKKGTRTRCQPEGKEFRRAVVRFQRIFCQGSTVFTGTEKKTVKFDLRFFTVSHDQRYTNQSLPCRVGRHRSRKLYTGGGKQAPVSAPYPRAASAAVAELS
jgi:hypothetical protein